MPKVAPLPATPKTPAELRRFGCTVGGVFLVLAAISWWRGHEIPPLVLATLGTLLVVPGLLFPAVLGPVERGWMAFALVLGAINTRILLTLVYVVVVTPIAWLRRLSEDPLDRRLGTDATSHWVPREKQPIDPESYRKQF
jgi:hypothetical protein